MTAETSNARGDAVAWFPTNAQGEIIRNYGDGSPVYACRTKEEAEQAKRCHLGATGPVIPLYAAPQPPSAPVGVEAIAAEIRASLGRGATVSTRRRWAVELEALAQQPAAPTLAKYQPCGCVICTCEDEQQCQGCGAKHCGNRADHPPYVVQQPAGVDEAAREDATPPATSPVRILIDAIESEIRQLEGKADWKSQTARIASLRAALDAAIAAQHQEPKS